MFRIVKIAAIALAIVVASISVFIAGAALVGPEKAPQSATVTVTGQAVPNCAGGIMRATCTTGSLPVQFANGDTVNVAVDLDKPRPGGSTMVVYNRGGTWGTNGDYPTEGEIVAIAGWCGALFGIFVAITVVMLMTTPAAARREYAYNY